MEWFVPLDENRRLPGPLWVLGRPPRQFWGELHLLGRHRLAPHIDPPPLGRGWLHIRQ